MNNVRFGDRVFVGVVSGSSWRSSPVRVSPVVYKTVVSSTTRILGGTYCVGACT